MTDEPVGGTKRARFRETAQAAPRAIPHDRGRHAGILLAINQELENAKAMAQNGKRLAAHDCQSPWLPHDGCKSDQRARNECGRCIG